MTNQKFPDRSLTLAKVGETLGVFTMFAGAVMLMSAGAFLPAKTSDFSAPQRQSTSDQTTLLAPPTSLSVAPGSGESSADNLTRGI